MIGSEKYIRSNGKWAKITHVARGKYAVAYGWAGQFNAVRMHSGGTKDWADISARSWIND
jgi:hypothetical protein